MRCDIPAARTTAETSEGGLDVSTLAIICGSLSFRQTSAVLQTGLSFLAHHLRDLSRPTYNAFTTFCQALYSTNPENMLILRIQFYGGMSNHGSKQ
jgi:hypothetical protein